MDFFVFNLRESTLSVQNYKKIPKFASVRCFFRKKSDIFANIRQILLTKFAKLKNFYYLCTLFL